MRIEDGGLRIVNQSPESSKDLVNRFTYVPPKEGQPERYQKIRKAALEFATMLDAMVPPSREKSLAMTHLEEVVMWANAGIARHE